MKDFYYINSQYITMNNQFDINTLITSIANNNTTFDKNTLNMMIYFVSNLGMDINKLDYLIQNGFDLTKLYTLIKAGLEGTRLSYLINAGIDINQLLNNIDTQKLIIYINSAVDANMLFNIVKQLQDAINSATTIQNIPISNTTIPISNVMIDNDNSVKKKYKLISIAIDIAMKKDIEQPIQKIEDILKDKPYTFKFLTTPYKKDEFKFKNKTCLLLFAHFLKHINDYKTTVLLNAFDSRNIYSTPGQFTDNEWNDIRKNAGLFNLTNDEEIFKTAQEYLQLIQNTVKTFEKNKFKEKLATFKPFIIEKNDDKQINYIQINDPKYTVNVFKYLIQT